MRIDKFLWSVRLFKTRTLATKACSNKRVKIKDQVVKPGKIVEPNVQVSVKTYSVWRTYEVMDVPKNRVGPKLVSGLINEITSVEILEQIEEIRESNRNKHAWGRKGRPTKKFRRDIDNIEWS